MATQLTSAEVKSLREHAEAFWRRVDKSGKCWLWKGHCEGTHGIFTVRHANYRAHRFAWMLTNGVIPSKRYVGRSCGNLLCVNPKHLVIQSSPEGQKKRFGANPRVDDSKSVPFFPVDSWERAIADGLRYEGVVYVERHLVKRAKAVQTRLRTARVIGATEIKVLPAWSAAEARG